jgi:hypothetical protein
VPIERRAALQSYRDKRRLWLSWLDTDEHHAIWTTLHSMVWTEVAFQTLTGFALGNDENALNNPLIVEALLNGHVATQVLAIRRLMEDTQKDRITIRRLVKDLRRGFNLLTRENFVCFDGLPYDYESVRDAHIEKLVRGRASVSFAWMPIEGPEADGTSQLAHEQFDKLAGVDPTKRSRQDRLPNSLIDKIEGWLEESGADDLAEWSHAYLAHAGGPEARRRIADLQVTANKITDAIRVLARTAEAISSWLLNAGGRSSAVMPVAQFNQFEKLGNPIMQRGGEAAAYQRWHELSARWNQCLNGVGDDLLGRSKTNHT